MANNELPGRNIQVVVGANIDYETAGNRMIFVSTSTTAVRKGQDWRNP